MFSEKVSQPTSFERLQSLVHLLLPFLPLALLFELYLFTELLGCAFLSLFLGFFDSGTLVE